MSALTYEIKDPHSPVALWLRTTFPRHKDVQSAYRAATGPAQVIPGSGASLGTQGTAIDWWLRFLVDPKPSVGLALQGLAAGRDLPCRNAGLRLLDELGVLGPNGTVVPLDPSRHAGHPDDWWARVSYSLALLVELFRAGPLQGSRLQRLDARSGPDALLGLANDAEVADLIAMRDLALTRLIPELPAGPVATGMTFKGSGDLAADGDLIAGGTLVDFKASQGGAPRKDGTRAASLARHEINQLLGYALMDYTDQYRLDTLRDLRHPLRTPGPLAHRRPHPAARRPPHRPARPAAGVRHRPAGRAPRLPERPGAAMTSDHPATDTTTTPRAPVGESADTPADDPAGEPAGDPRVKNGARLPVDFHRLWAAYTISAIGTAVSSGALPLIAITVLRVSIWQVSALAALSGIASAIIALPFGDWIEHRHKRPVMITADLVRAGATLTVPAAALAGHLTYPLLCAVAVINSAATIAFAGASGAHLKALVPTDRLTHANSRLETAFWITNTAGSSAGGLLITLLGSTATLAVDAASYLLSALGVRAIQAPEPAPPRRTPSARSRWAAAGAGWAYILARPDLRKLLWNAQLFGATIMAAAPLTTVLMLDDLHFTPWQYGLVLGLPCLGGIIGAGLTPHLTRRFGLRTVMLTTGLLRAPWLLLTPLAPQGPGGVALLVGIDFGLLVCVGVFNPTFTTYRMNAVDDHTMARVTTAWSITSRTTQPLAIAAAGLLAGIAGLRPTIAVCGLLCTLSIALLPWSHAPAPESTE